MTTKMRRFKPRSMPLGTPQLAAHSKPTAFSCLRRPECPGAHAAVAANSMKLRAADTVWEMIGESDDLVSIALAGVVAAQARRGIQRE